MNKTYQPFIIKLSEQFIDVLTKIDFFKIENISSKQFAMDVLCEELTKKFLTNGLSLEDDIYQIFDDEELVKILNLISITSDLDSLIKKGLIDSIENVNGVEVFFLTEKGKETAKELNL